MAAEIIRRDSVNAYFKRINWRFMDELVQKEFENSISDPYSANILGGMYISRAKDGELIKSSDLISSQYINSTHIYTGHRLLGVNIIDAENKTFEAAFEKNSQLWYAQGPSGEVIVFIGPYESNVGKIKETEIIIGKYQNPSQITERHIKKHFSIYFKYCVSTAQNSASNMRNYIYRLFLKFNDFRLRSMYLSKIIKAFERLAIIMFAGGSIWVALYVAGKL